MKPNARWSRFRAVLLPVFLCAHCSTPHNDRGTEPLTVVPALLDATSQEDSFSEETAARFAIAPRSSMLCTRNEECDDHIDCTHDRCDNNVCSHTPVHARCGSRAHCTLLLGCVATRACRVDRDCIDHDPCTVHERCDPSSRSCVWETLDEDEDGTVPISCGGDDCDDSNKNTHPRAPERCDGRDNNCNGSVDEQAELFCGAGTRCVDALCQCRSTNEMVCEERCVDTSSSQQHCGACGHACGPTQRCVQGRCRCLQEEQTVCGMQCVSLEQDPRNCGSCFNYCGTRGYCRSGRCE